MRKLFFFAAIAAISLVACNKSSDTALNNPPIQKADVAPTIEKTSIARLTDKNEIELLFLQKDAQEFFAKENPGETLVFVEVQDDNKDGKDAGLLYRIFNENEKVAETSISFVVTLEKGIYYVPTATTLQYATEFGAKSVKCSTTNEMCLYEGGCVPTKDGKCKPCPKHGTCTQKGGSLTELESAINALAYATSVYTMY